MSETRSPINASHSATRASLIVLNYNGAAVIEACVASLLSELTPSDEIIVVDNASPDDSWKLVPTHPQVRLIRRTSNNFIFGLNDGVAASSARYVAFLNNDIVVRPGFVNACIDEFDDRTFATCPRILDRTGADQGALTTGHLVKGLLFYTSLPHDDGAAYTFFAVGGQSFFDRSKLLEIGSIDELFWPMYHEDIELSYRAWKAGWVVRYAGAAVVDHVGGHSSKRRFTDAQLRSFVRQNEYLTAWKNFGPTLLVQHVWWVPLRLLAAVAHRDWPTLVGFARAAGRVPRVRQARRLAASHHRVSDRDVLRLVGQTQQRD